MSISRNLYDLIDVNILKTIQDRLAEITGLAYNIVDFKGNPINNYSNFSAFCKKMRSTPEGLKICCDTNAHAGLEAALREKPYIFKCPAGLVDVAIPIIVNRTYLGAVFFGQVRTNNTNLLSINKTNFCIKKYKKDTDFKNDYFKTIYVNYDKIESIASLVHTIINQLVQKSILNSIQEELDFYNIKLMKEREDKIKLEKSLITLNLKLLQSKINPYFLFNTLNSISKLALIEDSPKTQESIYCLAEFLRYISKHVGHDVPLGEDIKNLTQYLKIQSIRFGNRIKYTINIEDKIKNVKIPSMVLMCFIENAILHGICPKNNGGNIEINGYLSENNAVVTIKDDGVGISKDKLFLILNNNEQYKNESMGMGIYNANEILVNCYGKNYRVEIKSEVTVGTIIKLKFPFN